MKKAELSLRHTTIGDLDFIISSCKDEEESLHIAYEFTKKLFVGICKRSEAYDNSKYNITELPFTYSERQLDSVVLPQIASMTKGLVIAEYPVDRYSRSVRTGEYDSKGRIDYWCIYKDYSLAIEMKHSYDAFSTDSTKDARLIQRWRKMNVNQLQDIKDELRKWVEQTKGIIRLGLHFITPYKSTEQPTKEDYERFKSKQKEILWRLYEDVSNKKPSLTTPDFMSSWIMKKSMVMNFNFGITIPGLMLLAKFFPAMKHNGSTL